VKRGRLKAPRLSATATARATTRTTAASTKRTTVTRRQRDGTVISQQVEVTQAITTERSISQARAACMDRLNKVLSKQSSCMLPQNTRTLYTTLLHRPYLHRMNQAEVIRTKSCQDIMLHEFHLFQKARAGSNGELCHLRLLLSEKTFVRELLESIIEDAEFYQPYATYDQLLSDKGIDQMVHKQGVSAYNNVIEQKMYDDPVQRAIERKREALARKGIFWFGQQPIPTLDEYKTILSDQKNLREKLVVQRVQETTTSRNWKPGKFDVCQKERYERSLRIYRKLHIDCDIWILLASLILEYLLTIKLYLKIPIHLCLVPRQRKINVPVRTFCLRSNFQILRSFERRQTALVECGEFMYGKMAITLELGLLHDRMPQLFERLVRREMANFGTNWDRLVTVDNLRIPEHSAVQNFFGTIPGGGSTYLSLQKLLQPEKNSSQYHHNKAIY
jgi:hypothetical protein